LRTRSLAGSIIGTLESRFRKRQVRAEKHGFIWCFGANLSRLLRLLLVIKINKEFAEFLSDPIRERLIGWQSFIRESA
jgi:hypothetical protein